MAEVDSTAGRQAAATNGTALAATEPRSLPVTSAAALLLDATAVAVISLAILLAAGRLELMTALVATVLLGRLLLLARFGAAWRAGWSLRAELGLLAVCTAVGAFNDYNTVVRHGVYRYTVPCYWPELSSIPLWMLLYWGMILRLLLLLARWPALGASATGREGIARSSEEEAPGWLPLRGAPRLLFELALLLVTRQLIYRWWGDPWRSWLPLALALVAALALLQPSQRQRRLMALLAVGGTAVEIAYIQLGGLHRYALGWLGGVPLWIALWWPLGGLLLDELGAPLERWLAASAERRRVRQARLPVGPTLPQ